MSKDPLCGNFSTSEVMKNFPFYFLFFFPSGLDLEDNTTYWRTAGAGIQSCAEKASLK